MIASGLTDRLAGHLPVSIPTGIHPLERSTAAPLCFGRRYIRRKIIETS